MRKSRVDFCLSNERKVNFYLGLDRNEKEKSKMDFVVNWWVWVGVGGFKEVKGRHAGG